MGKHYLIQLTFSLLILLSTTANADQKLIPPSALCNPHKKIFTTYLNSPPHKAFAVSADGAFGWSAGKNTLDEAKKAALASCQKYSDHPCKIYAIDDNQFKPSE